MTLPGWERVLCELIVDSFSPLFRARNLNAEEASQLHSSKLSIWRGLTLIP